MVPMDSAENLEDSPAQRDDRLVSLPGSACIYFWNSIVKVYFVNLSLNLLGIPSWETFHRATPYLSNRTTNSKKTGHPFYCTRTIFHRNLLLHHRNIRIAKFHFLLAEVIRYPNDRINTMSRQDHPPRKVNRFCRIEASSPYRPMHIP